MLLQKENDPKRFLSDRTESTLKNVCWWLCFWLLIAQVCNVIIRCFLPSIQGCFVITEALIELLGVLAIILAVLLFSFHFLNRSIMITPWSILLLMLLVWAGISTLLADDRTLAWVGTEYRNDGYSSYLRYAGFFICASHVHNESRKRALLWIFGIMISALSAISVAQGITGTLVLQDSFAVRYAATFSNINHFAYILSIGIQMLAGLAVSARHEWERWIAISLFAMNLWALIMNQTMGAFVGIVFGLVAMLFLFPAHEKRKYRRGIILVLVVFILTSLGTELATGQLKMNLKSVSRGISIEEISNEDTGETHTELVVEGSAGSGRMRLWRQAWNVYIPERPIFGFGPEGLAQRYYDDGYNNDRPHNEYLQTAVFLGIPAALMYIAALAWLFIFCVKNIKKLDRNAIVLGIAVISYCVSAFFGNTMYYTSPYFFMTLGLLSGAAARIRQQKE